LHQVTGRYRGTRQTSKHRISLPCPEFLRYCAKKGRHPKSLGHGKASQLTSTLPSWRSGWRLEKPRQRKSTRKASPRFGFPYKASLVVNQLVNQLISLAGLHPGTSIISTTVLPVHRCRSLHTQQVDRSSLNSPPVLQHLLKIRTSNYKTRDDLHRSGRFLV
jgi:hypothetical protein